MGRNDLLSHECLLLFAIMLEPVQTPLPLVVTQLPPSKNWPLPHTMQLFDVGSEHVEHEGEQGWHAGPLLKLPSGQTVPELVTDFTASHFVRSLASWVKPCLQVTQMPLPSAHCWQPSPQTAQLPFPSRKNPGAQVEH